MFFFPSKIFNHTTVMDKSLANPCPTNYNHVWDHFENYRDYNLQEVCITLRPKYHQQTSKYMYTDVKTYIQRAFRRLRRLKPSYIFVPEYTKAGIIHFHGLIMFLNCQDTEYHIAEFKRKIGNKYGNTKGQQVVNLLPPVSDGDGGYLNYLKKDIHKSKSYILPFYKITPSA